MFAARMARAPAPHEIDAILEAYHPVLAQECATSPRFKVLDGAFEAVGWLRARGDCVVGLATGNTLAGARVKLSRAGLADQFAFGGYGSDSAVRAEVVATAIARGEAVAKTRATAVVVVGDTMHDVRAAKACEALCVAVTTGSEPRTALEAGGADAVIDSLHELIAWHEARFATL
jgi:phosphoglycolate phosphatase-like HAD superfamily hydrolase